MSKKTTPRVPPHITPDNPQIVSCHNITFYKSGHCKRCGECENKPKPCPHFSWKDGLATCDTYGTGDYLEKQCYLFPDNPFCYVVLHKICGFVFEPVTESDVNHYKELLAKWQLTT